MVKIISHKKAFTLIEVLVACSILIILITAVVELGVTIINGSVLSRQRVTAYYLAQEGIETIRQIRDSNLIDSNEETSWKSLVYAVQPAQIPQASNFPELVIDSSQTYEVGLPSFQDRMFLAPSGNGEQITVDGVVYTRKITFVRAGISIPEFEQGTPAENQVQLDANAVRAIVNISWKYKNSDKNIEVRELITNWKQLL